jgi:DNA-directed RNA polymerase subunit RPC12/RpoP
MKPKTALQKQIVELSSQLPKITAEQEKYSSEKSFLKWGVISRGKNNCLECAHIWKEDKPKAKVICPNCNSKLKMYEENKVLFEEREYFSVLDVKENFQVVRMILSVKQMKKGETPKFYHTEVMQHFIDEKGQVTSMAKKRQSMSMSMYYDQWCYGSELSLQDKSFRYRNLFRLNPYSTYPIKSVLPIMKRNGFKTSFYNIAPQELFTHILTDTTAETLLKTKQKSVLTYYIQAHRSEVTENWNSIKICSKNGFIIKDFGLWKDYISLLKHFGKDTKNPKYICPSDFKQAHDRLVEKKRRIDENQRRAEQKEKLIRDKPKLEKSQKEYLKAKQAFFGLILKQGSITVKVLESVEDFLEEGNTHKHCVFTNKYFDKKESLILSASIAGKKLETIEISLKNFSIIQSRGIGNKATKHNGKIIDLVNKNLPKIEKLATKIAV